MPDARAAIVDGTSAERDAQYQAAIASFLLGTAAVAGNGEALIKAVEDFVTKSEPQKPSLVSGLVTILFTDIESSTALTQRLGDAEALELVRAHNAIVRDALAV